MLVRHAAIMLWKMANDTEERSLMFPESSKVSQNFVQRLIIPEQNKQVLKRWSEMWGSLLLSQSATWAPKHWHGKYISKTLSFKCISGIK